MWLECGLNVAGTIHGLGPKLSTREKEKKKAEYEQWLPSASHL